MKRLSDLPSRDVDLLSAHIDRGLSPRQEKKLLDRLERDPELRRALDELRRTVSVLRSLPEVRPPKSYTLTPETAPPRERVPAYPVLQLATALATLAFVAVLGLDTLASRARPAVGAPAAQEQVERMAASQPEETSTASASEARPFLEETQPVEAPQALSVAPAGTPTPFPTPEGFGGGGPPTGLPEALEASPSMPPEEAAEDRALIGPGTPCVGCGGRAGEGPGSEEPPMIAQAPPEGSIAVTETPTAGLVEKIEQPPPTGELANAPVGVIQPSGQSRPGIPLVRLAEISLGLAAVIMAGLTIWVRRRG